MDTPKGTKNTNTSNISRGYDYEGPDGYEPDAAANDHVNSHPIKEERERTKDKEENKDNTYISSSLNREKTKHITEDVRNLVSLIDGEFSVASVYSDLGVTSKQDKDSIRQVLADMKKKGILESIGKKSGIYRKPNKDYEVIVLDDEVPEPLPVSMPLRIDALCDVYEGMSLLTEGEKSSGKSAYAIEFAWLNRNLFPDKVRYMQNGELNKQMLQIRLKLRPQDIYPLKKFTERIEFITRHGDWWDIINPEGLNIIDYIEEHEKKYLIPDYISKIQARLTTGIALIMLQRVPGREYGTGGAEIRNKPSVICSLKRVGKINTIHIEDVKSFNANTIGNMFGGEGFNPRGLWREYKLVDGWKFLPQGDWRTKDDTEPSKPKYPSYEPVPDYEFVREE